MDITFLIQAVRIKQAASFALLDLNAKSALLKQPLVNLASTVPLEIFRNLAVPARFRKFLGNTIHRVLLARLVIGASHSVFHL
jgi:hypothetical protein